MECPDELARWLVAEGADVDAPDSYGASPLWERASLGWADQIPLLLSLGADIERTARRGQTPLHAAAGGQKPETVRALIAHGANVHAVEGDYDGTPLMSGLRDTQNADIEGMAQVAGLLIEAGAAVTDEMREEVERIGRDFEFDREGFNPDDRDSTGAALTELYRLFGATPVVARQLHDGVSPIIVPDGPWQERHEALWELLVPSSGAAATVQGEAVRVSGRIAREILDNGAANWDRDFRAMLAALPGYLVQGAPLPVADLQEVRALVHSLRSGDGDETEVYRLSELAGDWVSLNPAPITMKEPTYER